MDQKTSLGSFTFMMNETSGRVHPLSVAHPGIYCDACQRTLSNEVRYACLQCDDYDLCDMCEASSDVRMQHHYDQHMFIKIRNTVARGGNAVINAMRQQLRTGKE